MSNFITKQCDYCKQFFQRTIRHNNFSIKEKYRNVFCSHKCEGLFKRKYEPKQCQECLQQFQPKQKIQKFCSQTCAAKFNNRNKKSGYRRSKLEIWLETKLLSEFPNLQFECNSRSIIGLELDFYFPNLKLAIELNGIIHYEPIYGIDKFQKIINNDNQKIINCYKQGIELIVINAQQKRFSDNIKNDIWEKISQIIKTRI